MPLDQCEARAIPAPSESEDVAYAAGDCIPERLGDPCDCAFTQVQSVGGLTLEQCDEHRNEYRVNDEYIIIARLGPYGAGVARTFIDFEWQMMVRSYPLWLAGELDKADLPTRINIIADALPLERTMRQHLLTGEPLSFAAEPLKHLKPQEPIGWGR